MANKTATNMTYKPTPMTDVVIPTRQHRNAATNRFMSSAQLTEKFKVLQNKTHHMTNPNQSKPKNDMQRFD